MKNRTHKYTTIKARSLEGFKTIASHYNQRGWFAIHQWRKDNGNGDYTQTRDYIYYAAPPP